MYEQLNTTLQLSHKPEVVSYKHDDLEVFLVGGTPRIYRLSRRQLLLMLLLACSGLWALFTYWNIFMLQFRLGSLHPQLNELPGNETLAEKLQREVRVLCWVNTTPKNHKARALHVHRTWGKRCNSLYFITSEHDDELNTVVINKTDKYHLMWGKVKAALTYFYEHKRHEADWFMKTDDDTYVFLENLRYMLYPYSPQMPIHFGFNFRIPGFNHPNASFMSGGSGYILSSEALRVFVNEQNDSSKCYTGDDRHEDVEIGKCLFKMGVPAGDSRDSKLRNRFVPMAPYATLISGYSGLDFWYYKYAYYNSRSCMDCLSDYPVAFHYISPQEMYVFDYFNYQFELTGRKKLPEKLPAKIAPEELIIPPSDNSVPP